MLTSMDSLNYITNRFYDFWLLLFVCVLCTSFNNTKYYSGDEGKWLQSGQWV